MPKSMSRRSSASRRQSSSAPAKPKRASTRMPIIYEDTEMGKVRRNPARAAKNNTGFRFVDEKNAEFERDAKAKKAGKMNRGAGKKEKNPKSYSDSRSKSRKNTSKHFRY